MDVRLDEAAGMLGAAELDLGRSFQLRKDVARIACATEAATKIDRRVFDGCCRRSRGQVTHGGQDDVRLDEARRRRTCLRRAGERQRHRFVRGVAGLQRWRVGNALAETIYDISAELGVAGDDLVLLVPGLLKPSATKRSGAWRRTAFPS